LSYKGYTFASDANDPLQFTIEQNHKYLYVQGKGAVTLPDGTQVTLPSSGVSEAVTIFSADFVTTYPSSGSFVKLTVWLNNR
jgi:hypothetical protein